MRGCVCVYFKKEGFLSIHPNPEKRSTIANRPISTRKYPPPSHHTHQASQKPPATISSRVQHTAKSKRIECGYSQAKGQINHTTKSKREGWHEHNAVVDVAYVVLPG